ncbi:MAG: hypothetical protein LBG93_03090 [Treponema sp.]|nr:hypothetical protein [Treponema sp.]
MMFFIRFRGQLRRTRPELVAALEGAVTNAASAAGGIAEAGRKVLVASFDEKRIGFWLDMLIFLQRAHKALEKASNELYGYTLALGRDIREASVMEMCRFTPERNRKGNTGIWCSEEVCDALKYYAEFDSAFQRLPVADGSANEKYMQLREWRAFDGKTKPRSLNFEIHEDIPPLSIRFGGCGCPLICFADALTPSMRSFFKKVVSAEVLEELESIHTLLFRERLRKELSPYITELVRRFIRSLFSAYSNAVKAYSNTAQGAIILEALHLADASACKIFKEVYKSLGEDKERIVLAYADSTEKSQKNWSVALNHVITGAYADFPLPAAAGSTTGETIDDTLGEIPPEIMEVSYNIFLLGKYFPDHLIPDLFAEQGMDRQLYFSSQEMLFALGVIPSKTSILSFDKRSDKALAGRKEIICRAVRKIILSWVKAGKLRPSFNLLITLYELGDRADDDLTLTAIKAEVRNGTPEGIANSIKGGHFDSLVGAENSSVLAYIFRTLNALTNEDNEAIQQAFLEPVPSMTIGDSKQSYAAYQAQVQINLAAFYVGRCNGEAASEHSRKALFLNRDLGKNAVPAHRIFALAHLSQKRVDDAIEYIYFALEQAENSDRDEELILAYYQSASINLLNGNLSKAQRFAVKAEDTAASLGQSGWVLCSRFLIGRILFEIGKYSEALETFQSIENALTSYNSAAGNMAAGSFPKALAVLALVQAWLFRSRLFLGGSYVEGEGTSVDSRLFAIEAAYFSNDFEKAKTLSEKFLSSLHGSGGEHDLMGYHSSPQNISNPFSGGNFIFTEQPDWRSGFTQCEDMLFGRKSQGAKMAWIYLSMAQCALEQSKEAKSEILGAMQRFMRDELLPDTDPNDSFLFFAWYCMLRDSDAAQVDIDMVVSMGYKRVQRRASKIDDLKTKQVFLNMSRWNKTLTHAAKEFKLI